MTLRLSKFILSFLLLGLLPGVVSARSTSEVEGVVLYGAGQYRSEVDGNEEQRAKVNYQQVALRYQKLGELGDARLGNYTLMLGYEFSLLDPSLSTHGVEDDRYEQIETGKLFYQGAILVAPGGLPFRLNAYARDNHQTSFIDGAGVGILPVGRQPEGERNLIDSNFPTVLSNGTQRELGATLLLGIRNGSYLGNYRDILSQLPRLMIDYRQIDVRDTSQDFNRTHSRSRDLAFISLNKKDNWVHFRVHDYIDFVNELNNQNTSQVMIGTVDHTMSRQWINLTNWIKVSADFSLTVDKDASFANSAETFLLNIFTSTRLEKSQTTVYSSLERTVQGESVRQTGDLPVYVTYEPNRDSLYRGRFKSAFYRDSLLDASLPVSSDSQASGRSAYIGLGAELFRTRAVVFKPDFQFEARNNNGAQVFSEKLGLEWANRGGKQSVLWVAGLSTAATQETDDTTSSDYLENSLYGSAEKNLSKSLRAGVNASARSGDGTSSDTGTIAVGGLDLSSSNKTFNNEDVTSFQRYNIGAFLDHVGQLYSNRLELTVDSVRTDLGNIATTEIEHMLRTRRQNSDFTLTNSLLFGDKITVQTENFDYVDKLLNPGNIDLVWSSRAEYYYTPGRHLRFALNGGVSGSEGEGSKNQSWSCSEQVDYRIYTTNGIVRQLAAFSEEIAWESVDVSTDGRDSALILRLTGGVYPTKYFYAKVTSELVTFGPSGAKQTRLRGETGLNFEKLQVALNYARGNKEQEDFIPEVMEERWDLKVRKTF